jgi:mRNA-degrading endonuclease RelE of RelBE toxin-antitoxin system
MRIFTTIQRFAETGEGDVKGLKGESGELRLRVGDYRVRFTDEGDDTI